MTCPFSLSRPAKLGGQPVRKCASRGFGQIELQEIRRVAFGPLICASFGPVHRSIVTSG
jgi:hypothetical protein